METRAQSIARAIKSEGESLAKLEIKPTSRPLGGWKWGKAYSYGVFHPARSYALAVADFKIQAKRGAYSQPAKGWEAVDACARLDAERIRRELIEGAM